MSKNYFTDEQIREIYYSEAGDSIESGAFEFYRSLFNKAVETAIDVADGWKVTGPFERVVFQDKSSADAFCEGLNKGFGDVAYFVTPLYSVKELEN